MNFKRSTTSMAIAIMALSLISMTSVQQDVFASGLGMSITATADQGSNIIIVTGITNSDVTDVTYTVTAPNGNIVQLGQLTPDENGEFMIKLLVGILWPGDGLYEIRVMQSVTANSLYTLDVEFQIT
ncbi:MAG: PEFG-CTERM domain-containing protein, partial [Nitrosopumilus sp.]